MVSGYATAEGTARFAARFPEADEAGFFRQVQNATSSSLGIGTYLGSMDDATDRNYTAAMMSALRSGVNFVDTSLNYRHQRSELAIGRALTQLFSNGFRRDEIWVCTKAGYLVPNAVPVGSLRMTDLAGGMHSVAPVFLRDQLERSRSNLGLETIDVFYLHNPETQLSFVNEDEFYTRIQDAFACLEEEADAGRIRFYGTATWEGFRRQSQGLSLPRILQAAEKAGGTNHRFRFIQLPLNLAMMEAYQQRSEVLDGQPANVLEVAGRHGIATVGSATLLQARLSRNLPRELALRLPGLSTDAQRAIQFARSTPGLAVSLVGMSRSEHVLENVAVSRVPPLDRETYGSFFQSS